MVLLNNGKIVLDEFMLRQYSMVMNVASDEYQKKIQIKSDLEQLESLKDINEARELIYNLFPDLKEQSTCYYEGIEFRLRDSEEKLSLLVKLNREIKSYSFRAKNKEA
jgi:hypothetical protein